jgi:hypothetical protein
MLRVRVVGVGVCLTSVILLSGCTSDFEVDLSAVPSYEVDVGACVMLAGSGERRDDPSPPRFITIRVDSAEQKISETIGYEVTGRTIVATDGQQSYRWTCVTEENTVEGSLVARITSFQRDDD